MTLWLLSSPSTLIKSQATYDSPTLASHARMCSNAAADVNNALHSPEGDVKHTVTVNYGPYMN